MLDQLEELTDEDADEVRALVEEHLRAHRLAGGQRVLDAWQELLPRFVKVFPTDYKRVLAEQAAAAERGDRRLMGELGGFLKIERVGIPYDDPAERIRGEHTYKEFVVQRSDEELAAQGGALHGVRRALLPQRLPAGQPHPRLERPRLPRPLAGRHRASCTRRTTSPSSPAACARRPARRRACWRSARATR